MSHTIFRFFRFFPPELVDNVNPKQVEFRRISTNFCVQLFISIVGQSWFIKINAILFRFIWNKKINNEKKVTEKLKREVVNKAYADGGLNMIDIFKFQDSFLLKWADRLFDEHSQSWKDGPKHFFQNIGGISALKSNQTVSKFKGVELINSPFWKRVLITWLNYKNLDLDKAVLTLKLNPDSLPFVTIFLCSSTLPVTLKYVVTDI